MSAIWEPGSPWGSSRARLDSLVHGAPTGINPREPKELDVEHCWIHLDREAVVHLENGEPLCQECADESTKAGVGE